MLIFKDLGKHPVPNQAEIAKSVHHIVTMNRHQKLLLQILRGTSDANIHFQSLCRLLRHLKFEVRIRGDHHIFTKEGIIEILNIQPKGKQAKPYQVRQIRNVILKYRLGDLGDD